MDADDTQELRIEQVERARSERAAVEDASTENVARQHDRRAEKAAYLAAKLAEREQSELDAARED